MKKNYLSQYGVASTKKVRAFQEGGPMGGAPAPGPGGPEGGAPAPEGPAEGGGAPDLEGMVMEYAQSRDPELAVAIADSLVEALAAQQGAGGPEGAPAGPGGPPPGAAPAGQDGMAMQPQQPAPQASMATTNGYGRPVFRRGGSMNKR